MKVVAREHQLGRAVDASAGDRAGQKRGSAERIELKSLKAERSQSGDGAGGACGGGQVEPPRAGSPGDEARVGIERDGAPFEALSMDGVESLGAEAFEEEGLPVEANGGLERAKAETASLVVSAGRNRERIGAEAKRLESDRLEALANGLVKNGGEPRSASLIGIRRELPQKEQGPVRIPAREKKPQARREGKASFSKSAPGEKESPMREQKRRGKRFHGIMLDSK